MTTPPTNDPQWTDRTTPGLVELPGMAGLSVAAAASRRLGGCSRPVLLVGRTDRVDPSTGEVVWCVDSAGLPGGRLAVVCGDRRASVCPACSRTYQSDTYHLVGAGLAGGKSVPGSVAGHPAVFATFTPPGFGPVHTRRSAPAGRVLACRPRRELPTCEHGRPGSCPATHRPDDPLLGQPLCPGCFDYPGAVLWQAHVTRLWDRTVLAVRRRLAAELGVPVSRLGHLARVAFVRVAEFQRRGLVHLHAVIRVDGPTGPADPPPAAATAAVLEAAVRAAHARVEITGPYSPAYGELVVRWGPQLDVQPIHPEPAADTGQAGAGDGSGVVGRRAVASYLAKYATKSTHDAGLVTTGRVRRPSDLDSAGITEHARAMAATCWRLGGLPEYAHLRLRAWAHSLGWRGHPSTKSRQYSTTLTALREARAEHRRQLSHPQGSRPQGVLLTDRSWRYAGRGQLPVPGLGSGGDDDPGG